MYQKCNRYKIFSFLTVLIVAVNLVSAQSGKNDTLASWFSNGLIDKSIYYYFAGSTKAEVVTDKDIKNRNCLKISFDDREYAGTELVLGAASSADLHKVMENSVLHFKIKGLTGGEKIFVSLMDNGDNGKNKCEVKCKSENFAAVKNTWIDIDIPLREFSREGERWFIDKNAGDYCIIDWKKISTVKFSTAMEMNYGIASPQRLATVFVDDIKIITNQKTMPEPLSRPWRMLNEKIAGPSREKDSLTISEWFTDSLPEMTTVYLYDERTDFSVIKSVDSSKFPVFATYMNDKTWSGVTIARSKNNVADISSVLGSGGIEFNVKGASGGELFTVGLIDDDSDGANKNVQSRLSCAGFIKVTDKWQTVSIPFDEFGPSGAWWDPVLHKEVLGKIDWKRIAQVRFSVNKFDNRHITKDGEEPVRLYFADVKFVKKLKNISNKQYWSSFKSDSAEQMIFNFENEKKNSLWEKFADSLTEMNLFTTANDLDKSEAFGVEYKISEYGNLKYSLESDKSVKSNWSYYNSVKLDMFTEKNSEAGAFMIIDKNKEAWVGPFEIVKGWQTVVIPFQTFKPYEWWQPEGAKLDNRMDMDNVREMMVCFVSRGKKYKVAFDNIRVCNESAENSASAKGVKKRSLRVNQEGYYAKSIKEFIVADSGEKNFAIIDSNGKLAFEGKLDSAAVWDISGEKLRRGEFTPIVTPGIYTIVLQESGEKTDFVIKQSIYKLSFDASLKTFYFQRSSVPLLPQYAGIWARAKGHDDTSCELLKTNTSGGPVNVSGGWYDAGDYGKYTVNAAFSAGTMLGFAELCPSTLHDTLKIPESGNKIPDMLDELRYEIDWLIRMQDTDGGAFFKVGSKKWDGFIQPCDALQQRFVIGKSTASTLDLCACLAMASRVYKKIDKKFSGDCLKRAIRAWEWAKLNPKVSEPSEGGGTGLYGDDLYDDEFFWAAAELYATTKKNVYKSHIESFVNKKAIPNSASWNSVENLGWYTLATQLNPQKDTISLYASNLIIDAADRNIDIMKLNPYQIPETNFYWGSNSVQLNSAVLLCYAYSLTKKNKYFEAVVRITDYIFGKNAVDYCFVTGFGTRYPRDPHHRPMGSDTTNAPIPGFIVGGPNAGIEDEKSMEPGVFYPDKEPACAYIDNIRAYASNETAINWNAVLTFVLGFLVENETAN